MREVGKRLGGESEMSTSRNSRYSAAMGLLTGRVES